MKKILFINSVCNGSTGKICKDLYDIATKEGYECCIAYGRGNKPQGYNTIKIGNGFNVYSHVLSTRLLDNHGFCSKKATQQFLNDVQDYNPDIIHIHNIHGYYLNVKMLFDFFKKSNIPVVWTLHDCWSFTGHCAYFLYSNCEQWKIRCSQCKSLKDYPGNLLFSNVEKNFNLKKDTFSNVPSLTLVTPSQWLKNLLKDSFLKDYECFVINNGIDLNIFRKKNNCKKNTKKLILGVANIWDNRKGLDSFIHLSKELDENYVIKLVGLNKKQIENLPKNIIGISRTDSVEELVDLYNEADVLFNPTLEDNYPTVNLEAQACGTPVVTFDTGGTKETLFSENCYIVKDYKEFLNLLKTIDFSSIKLNFKVDMVKLDKNKTFDKYIYLYKFLLSNK